MDEVEQAIFDGWRYLGLKASEVLSMTPREFSILMRAQVERQYDELERLAIVAIMHEAAHRSKRPKASDLFKRPVDEEEAKSKVEELKEKAEHATEWLAQFEQFNRKEVANG